MPKTSVPSTLTLQNKACLCRPGKCDALLYAIVQTSPERIVNMIHNVSLAMREDIQEQLGLTICIVKSLPKFRTSQVVYNMF